ncbi:SET domain-containing protein [Corynespora cassiicola Philippines]|uniref:SET domain-containing protein n=1 Tax=Corynespora cassiicola Philippines TaxID=1448308 RepID=A0A2T2P6I7_CORCC|nr:SET domain-containing protein [Corynespora cassiicola Philippines]
MLIMASYLFFPVASLIISVSASPYIQRLSGQCWHEFPLSRVTLETSKDGSSEVAKMIESPSALRANVPPPQQSPKRDYGQWSYAPVCTEVLESVGSQLCVYTNTSFSNGRGISIFTTPKIADEFAALPAFQDPSGLEDINTFSGAWYTSEIPGKGVGMLAKKQLKFKDRVTAYTPALMAYLEHELSTMQREKYFRIAVSQLPEPTREAYLQLATVYGQPQVRVQDIVKANTFQLEVGGQNHLAVFPETSRLNHACSPNAQYYLDSALLTHFVHATRPIAAGEEILISYTSPIELTDARQEHLNGGFHFTCTCPRCTKKEATDATIREMQAMQASLNDWSASSPATPKLAEKLVQIYRKEGLEGFLDIPYGFAALSYNAVGDFQKATKYAALARETILLKDGPWTQNLQMWNELLKDPQKHWSYKRRQS